MEESGKIATVQKTGWNVKAFSQNITKYSAYRLSVVFFVRAAGLGIGCEPTSKGGLCYTQPGFHPYC